MILYIVVSLQDLSVKEVNDLYTHVNGSIGKFEAFSTEICKSIYVEFREHPCWH